MADERKKTVSLVLGSGGARGLAHIGVIQEIEREGYEIRSVSGCSIGALVGGVFAAGKLAEFERWVRAIDKIDIVTLLDLSWGTNGLVKGDKVINTLVKLVGDRRIEELPIPFTAVATDIENLKEVWIRSGPLFDAIRASISLPLFFTPVRHRHVQLIDGGVLNPVPIAPTCNDETDITIAVNLGGRADRTEKKAAPPAPLFPGASPLHDSVNRFIAQLKLSVKSTDGKDWGVYEIANQAFEAMQSAIARQKLAAYPPDILIDIPRNACRALEFHRAAEMIDLGQARARECLSRVRDRSN